MRSLLYSGLVLLLCPWAYAAEHVTLSSGFAIDCTHHRAVGDPIGSQVRLYTSAGDSNYIDVAAAGITRIETEPDPSTPIAPAHPAAAQVAAAVPVTMSEQDLQPLLLRAGAEHRIDKDLLYSVVKAESAGHVKAVSRTGAQGLMQLMPETASDFGVADSFVPEQNVNGGAAYLDQLLTRYHDDITLALAAYNAGPQAVDRFHGIPPYAETRAYVRRVIVEFNRRKLAARALAAR